MLKAIVFDFDGLILDTEWPIFLAWQRLYAEAGHELDLHLWGQIVGGEDGTDFDPRRHLEQLTGKRWDEGTIKARIAAWEVEQIRRQPVMPGVRALLRQAQTAGVALAVASSSNHAWVDGHLQRLGLWADFSVVVCKEDVPRTKPFPDLFLLAAEKLGVAPAEAVVLEDSPNGVLAARRAGMKVVAVPNRVTAQLAFPRPDWQVASLAEVNLNALRALWA